MTSPLKLVSCTQGQDITLHQPHLSTKERSTTMKTAALITLVLLQVFAALCCEDVAYIGCYEDKVVRDLNGYLSRYESGMTINKCIARCKSKAYKYAGLQAAGYCLCGDSYGRYGVKPESECKLACPGSPSQKCGAGGRNSVFSTGYMGCWRDSAVRAMKNIWIHVGKSLTVEKCIGICKKAEFPYAGMQYAQHCFCAKKYQIYGEAPRKECNTKCASNHGQFCGGGWRNSVYATEVPTEF